MSNMEQFVVLILLPTVIALTGYDCGGEGLNITSLSLLDVGNCDMENLEATVAETYIQLMQLSDYDSASVIRCKVEIDRIIHYCGSFSHVSIVHNGRREYIQEIGRSTCRKIHETGILSIAGTVIDHLTRNHTNSRSVVLAGFVNTDGRCEGAQYSDSYGTWDRVVVQAIVRITLEDFKAPIRRSSGKIILPTGTHCPTETGECIDSRGAENFWTPPASDNCHFQHYDVLYEGLATKLSPRENQTIPIVYTVTTQETTFALTQINDFHLCGYRMIRTEHPKLFILETTKERTFRTRTKISVDNLDIFSYVNSKFIYVEKHIRTQLTQLYRDIMEQKCALEQQILKNALSLASIAPDEMAYRILKTPGYTAVVAGEVIYLVKCVPVQCKIRYTEQCYYELPVTHRNASLFLLPRSRLLSRKGTIRECNDLLPTMYKLQESWFKLSPKPTETFPPPIIQPLTQPAWKYVNPSSLATSGIYSGEDLERLKAHIMFPVEKPQLLNNLARGVMGERMPPGAISLLHLLDEETLDKLAESTGRRLWKGFVNFGSASAGILAIFIILRIIKLVIDTIIHGYALHSMYGWSMHLLGAIWSSITHLLLQIGRRENKNPENTEEITNSHLLQGNPQTTPKPPTQPPECRETLENQARTHYAELRRYLYNQDDPQG